MTKLKKTPRKVTGKSSQKSKTKTKSRLAQKPAPLKPFPVPEQQRVAPKPRHLQIEPYWKEMNKVIDPELNMGIIDLGLVYDIKIKNGHAKITMTLTTPACPYGPALLKDVQDRMQLYHDIKDVEIEIVWDPIWTQEMIDPDIRELMFGF